MKKNTYFLDLNNLPDQSQPNQTWWEWPARSVFHIFGQQFHGNHLGQTDSKSKQIEILSWAQFNFSLLPYKSYITLHNLNSNTGQDSWRCYQAHSIHVLNIWRINLLYYYFNCCICNNINSQTLDDAKMEYTYIKFEENCIVYETSIFTKRGWCQLRDKYLDLPSSRQKRT